MAAIFDLEQLIDMMSIGTLLAYTIVAICVLILRYRDPNPVMYEQPIIERHNGINGTAKPAITNNTLNWLKQVFNLSMMKYPSRTTEMIADWALGLFIIFAIVLCVGLGHGEDALAEGSTPVIVFITVMSVLSLIFLFILYRQPQAQSNLSFKVPSVPLIPCLSILMNFYLMVKLDVQTWVRFGIWLFIGMIIYIFYSIPNSVEGHKDKMVKEEMRQRQMKAQAANTGSLPRATTNTT